MDKLKKVYIESRCKTSDSISNSNFKFEIKWALDLLENTVCYIDGTSIPHSWYTTDNNKLYIENTLSDLSLSASVISSPSGNYNASNLASILQSVLQATFPNENYTCIYNTARGSITISPIRSFGIYTDDQVVEMTNNIGVQFPGWVGHNNQFITIDINNLMSMNEILRHSDAIPAETAFESGFIYLLNVHNVYIHCPNSGHYSTISVRGENSIITNICKQLVWASDYGLCGGTPW